MVAIRPVCSHIVRKYLALRLRGLTSGYCSVPKKSSLYSSKINLMAVVSINIMGSCCADTSLSRLDPSFGASDDSCLVDLSGRVS